MVRLLFSTILAILLFHTAQDACVQSNNINAPNSHRFALVQKDNQPDYQKIVDEAWQAI